MYVPTHTDTYTVVSLVEEQEKIKGKKKRVRVPLAKWQGKVITLLTKKILRGGEGRPKSVRSCQWKADNVELLKSSAINNAMVTWQYEQSKQGRCFTRCNVIMSKANTATAMGLRFRLSVVPC